MRALDDLRVGWDVRLRTTGKASPGRRSAVIEGRLIGRVNSPTRGRWCLYLLEKVTGARWVICPDEILGAERVLGKLDDRRRRAAR